MLRSQSGLDQVQAYFDNVAVDLKLFATRADTVTQLENMTRAFTALDIAGPRHRDAAGVVHHQQSAIRRAERS